MPKTKVRSRQGLSKRTRLTILFAIDTGAKATVTQSKPADFPSFLRQKLQSSVQAIERHNINTDSVTRETCIKCHREEVRYTNVQLRGADEGSTIFYMCDCGYS